MGYKLQLQVIMSCRFEQVFVDMYSTSIPLLVSQPIKKEVYTMVYFPLISTVLLAIVVVYYLYLRSTIKTWTKEKFLRKEEQSLEDVVERFQKAVTQLNPLPFMLMFLAMISLGIWRAFADPYMSDLWTAMVILLTPFIPIIYLAHRIFKLMLERAEALYAQE